MFSNYTASKQRQLPPWAPPLLGGAVIFHLGLFVAAWIQNIWDLEALERPKLNISLAVAAPPPPPPPPPAGSTKPQETRIEPKKKVVRTLVQNVRIEKPEEHVTQSDANGQPGGDEDGQAGGTLGGDPNGVLDAPPPPPPPPPVVPPPGPQNVRSAVLEASRISGDKVIAPDDVTKIEIQRAGATRLIGTYKLCLSNTGAITSVTMLKSTGFPSYDGKIQSKIRGEWRYRPYMANGTAIPVCTAVTFIYSQK